MRCILAMALMGVSVVRAFAEPQNAVLPVRVESGGEVIALPNGVSFASTFDLNRRPAFYGQANTEDTALFAKFTRRHTREMITVYVCDKAVTQAMLQTEIPNGTVMVMGEEGYFLVSTFLESGCP